MGDTFRLAMQLTMIDLLSGVADRAKSHIKALGEQGKQVARDFEQMERNATRGLKAIAVANYTINKIKPGVASAADMQEATLDVKMNLKESGQNAGELARQLAVVRATAVDIQKQMPFGAKEVMGTENVLLKAGLKMQDVTAKGGAAWAASALATMAKTDPQSIGEGMITIAAPFNLKGGEYAEVANFLQKVDQASVSTIPDLFEGMKMVAGQAAMMKVSWKDTLIAMGTLSQSGLKGTMGGTALGDFFERLVAGSRITRKMIAAVNADLARQGKQPLKFWDDKGHLKQLPVIIKNLRESMSGFTDEKKLLIMHKIFETQGGRAAAALMHEGAGSWEEVAAGVGKAADIQEKLNIRMEGFNANLKSLSGTSQTTAASFFSPWLEPLNAIIQKANDATAALGKFADKHPKTTDTVNGVLAAGVATAAGYGAYKLAKAGWYGGKVLKGLRGLPGASLAMGVAEGKAVQAATGVQPVFITNWPNSFGTAAAVANAGGIVAGGGGRAALAGTLATAGLVTSVVAAPLISKIISDAQRANGWDSHAFGRGTKEYEVMGVGGKKRDINLTVQIDSQGRLISRSDDMGSQIKTVRRGAFFDDMLVSH